MKKITVNAKPFEWEKETISYEEIVELAGKKGDYLTVVLLPEGKINGPFIKAFSIMDNRRQCGITCTLIVVTQEMLKFV